MSEATVRCPKCGHEGIVITELLDSDLRLIADSQAAEIVRLRGFRDAVVEAMVENAGGGQPFAYIWQRKWDEIKAAVEKKGR